MVVNGLRPIEEIFESEAVMLANASALSDRADMVNSIQTMLSATSQLATAST